MTQKTSADGKSFTNHKITNHLPDFEAAKCSSCHQSQQQITQLITDNKALLEAKAQQLQELLIKPIMKPAPPGRQGPNGNR